MQNLAVIEQENPVEIKLRNTSKELCEAAVDVMILTRHDLSHATDMVKIIKTRSKEIEEERTKLVKPFNEGVKAINARFKAMTAPLEEAEASIKAKMLTFQKEEERRAMEEAKRLEKVRLEAEEKARKESAELADKLMAENGDSGDIRNMPLPAAPAVAIVASLHRPTTYGQTGAVSTVKKVWTFEVTDIKALAAARPDLVLSNDVEINREIRGKGGDIAGLRIYEKEIMQVR
jgi:predicted secreted protein